MRLNTSVRRCRFVSLPKWKVTTAIPLNSSTSMSCARIGVTEFERDGYFSKMALKVCSICERPCTRPVGAAAEGGKNFVLLLGQRLRCDGNGSQPSRRRHEEEHRGLLRHARLCHGTNG